MSGDWTIARLGSLTEISYGFTQSASWERLGPKFLRITDIQSDGVDWEAVPYCLANESELGKFRLIHDDIVFARTGATTGKSFLVKYPPESVFASYLIRMRLKSPALLPRFLHLFFQTAEYWKDIEAGSSGSAQGGFNASKLSALQIKFPAISEQERIVAILDEAFEGIATAKASAEKNLQNARELFDNALQSLLRDINGDRVLHNMAAVCDIPSKLVDPREETYQDLPHVGAGNIEAKTGVLIDVLTARQEQLISGKFLFDESMVLYSKIRPYLMKVVRPDFSGLCSADIYPLAPTPGVITRDYLFYVLLSPEFTEYAIKGSARAGMPKVNREHLFAYELSLPSLQEQERIAATLDALAEEVQRLIAVYERKLAGLDELKKSLLHQAFSGQL